jgi:general secretion pathway protein D
MKRFLTGILLLQFLVGLAFPPQAYPAPEKAGVTFNFVDVELDALAKFISDVTGKNLIFDERVRGKVTIIAPSKLSSDDAFDLFASVLRLKGFAMVPSGVNAYKIVPISEARESGVDVVTKRPPINENFIARLISLEHISSDEAVMFLKPMVSRTGYISSFGPGNLLLVVDSGLNIEKIMDMLKYIDQPPVSEEPEVVFLRHSSAETVAALLNQGMQKRVSKGQVERGLAVADKRLNAVVLFGNKGMKDGMKRLIAMLDVQAEEMQSTINVYFLENADAEELSKVIQGIMKAPKPARPQARAPGAAPSPTSPFESLSGIIITPDKATNSLVIVASPADYASLSQVIKQLDRKRKQVYVEAMIVEATVDRLREIGSRWRATALHNNEPVVIGGVGTVDSSTISTILSGLSGLTVGGLGNYMTVPIVGTDGSSIDLTVPGFAALFSLSEFRGAVDILSSPQILTSDNTEAEIIVGQNVPFISKIERGLTTGDQAPFASIERKDVGITLRLTPQISEGDYVKLDIYQEISSVRESLAGEVTEVGPTTSVRSTKTSVVVRDAQTVVIGGLMEEKDEQTETRVPFLHRIPILGWLFKFKGSSKLKTNLLVFITPHVIKRSEDLARLSNLKEADYAKRENIYAPGELLVKFAEDVAPELALAILTEKEATVVEHFQDENLYRVKLREDLDVRDAVEEFSGVPEVEYAEPNYRISRDTPAGRMRR